MSPGAAEKNASRPLPRGFALVLASATVLLGLLVIVGWFTGNTTLIQVLPQFVPMQFNTALGFVLSGSALLLGTRERSAVLAGGGAALIGALTLVQYVLGVDIGIDELLMKHDITVETSHPGRMAPNTAICFLLFGLAAVSSSARRRTPRRDLVTVVLASLTFGLGLVALAGYFTALETAYGWGNLTRMAVHTSVGFLILGSGLLALVVSREDGRTSAVPHWLPVPLAIGVITATLCLWQALSAEAARMIRDSGQASSMSHLGIVILVGGALLAIALAVAAHEVQTASLRAREVAKANAVLEEEVRIRQDAERALQEHRDSLELQVAERTADLLRARKKAEAANHAKSAFLANMSHELRTPMNAIIGYAEMMIEEADELGIDECVPDLEKIQTAGRHLLALINDVLDLSKIEAGKMELHLEDFDAGSLLDDIAGTVDTLVKKKGNALVIERAGDLGSMHADLTKVRQALFNMISNAAKFTEGGTITVDARREREASGSEWLVFAVRDTGIGIAADKLDTLFEEFTQADSSTTRNFGGTGLGLAITRRFCEMMGGHIGVESELGSGATFTVRLPAHVRAPQKEDPAPVEAPTADSDAAHPPTDRPVVLVIDDDPAARDLLRRHLERERYFVAMSPNGARGLELARELRPMAITLDIMMPGTDGWTVLRELKADPDLQDIPVIVVSIVSEQGLGFSLGAAEHLGKPIDRDALSRILGRYRDADRPGDVLIVDDDEDARSLLRRVIEKEGWTVSEASDGASALERTEERMPSLVLLDLMMPVMDGFEFLYELRQRPGGCDVPIVVVTAKDLTADELTALGDITQQVFVKAGFRSADLLEEVHRAIASSQRPQGSA